MTRAGYITDNSCPINKDHGVCVRISDYMYCPHHEHDMDDTRSRWPMQMWEDVKDGTITVPTTFRKPKKASTMPTTTNPRMKPEKRPT
jgi:hypothetical protein